MAFVAATPSISGNLISIKTISIDLVFIYSIASTPVFALSIVIFEGASNFSKNK